MFRRLSPFIFCGFTLPLCSAQGLPGGFGGGGEPPVNASGQAPPAGAAPPVPPAGAPPAPPAGADGKNPGQFEPGWLNDRVEQAKRSERAELLKQLGVSDVDAAKAMLAEGKKAQDATKTEIQRLQDHAKELEPFKAQAEAYQKHLGDIATKQLSELPAEAQERIKALVGEKTDPIKLMEAVGLAKAMAPAAPGSNAAGQSGQQTPGQTPGAPGQGTPPAGPPPMAPPANTTGAQGGPPSAPGSPVDHFAHWNWLQEKQPMRAASYYLEHQNEIVAQQVASKK